MKTQKIVLSISFLIIAAKEALAQESGPLLASELGTVKKLINLAVEFCVKYSFQVLGGMIVLILGWLVSKVIANFLKKFLQKYNVDVTISKFLVTITKMSIIGFAALVALGKFGVTIAPFIAGLSVVGFGTSFALQGPLSNYAAGAILIFTKPFKVGHIIEVAGVVGEVEDVALARTQIKTIDGTKIVVPNKHIIGEVIHNCNTLKRLDLNIGISYNSDIDKAISLIKGAVSNDPRVASKPEVKIGVSEFADSSINIYSRLWTKQSDYWDVMFETNKKIFDEFNKNNIVIPFPQRDIHIKEGKLT